jgi:hypothetical protein|tara:strand:- start:576 stop:1064 length:489 start_codon:yes stop_codon:yes gene_type:complete
MAKFIKFPITNGATLGSGTGTRSVLLDVSKIESVADAVAGAAFPGALSVVITLSEYVGLEAGHADGATVPAGTVGGRILTLLVGTNTVSDPADTTGTGAVAIADPAAITVAGNMPSQSVNRALTANPGGVSSQVQLAKDGAGLLANAQMYFAQATFSSSNTI